MGGGRKTTTLTQKEKFLPSFKANSSASARNLRKSDLGGVIFGCKNNTIKECYFKDLFGLPAPHFAYVKNVTPGLLLFLFNYSDRRLHGIFEAISPGQMSINPYAWTGDGTEVTPYPAQVRVRIKTRCCTLTEDQFRPIIADNYYEQNLFWNELDRSQTKKLVTLFTSSPYNENASFSKNSTKWNSLFYSLPTSNTGQASSYTQHTVLGANCTTSDQNNAPWSSCAASAFCSETHPSKNSAGAEAANGKLEWNGQPSYSSIVSKKDDVAVSDGGISIPQKTWSSLFKTSSDYDISRENGNSRVQGSTSTSHPSDQSNMKLNATDIITCMDKAQGRFPETQGADFVAGQYSQECDTWESWEEHPYALTVAAESIPHDSTSYSDADFGGKRDGDECFETIDSDLHIRHLEESYMEWESSCLRQLGQKTCSPEDFIDWGAEEKYDQLKPNNCELTYSSSGTIEMTSEVLEKEAKPSYEIKEETRFFPVIDIPVEIECSDIQSVVVKLMQEIEGLKGSQLRQNAKISCLELELAESKKEILNLNKLCNSLETAAVSGHVGVEYGQSDRPFADRPESVLIVGGFDGSSWLSDLVSFSPSNDKIMSLCSMTFARSYASAAKLNGEVFVFGGVDGNMWFDTVESYSLSSDQWVNQPSLNKRKGSLAGVSIHNKIYAIGGGDGVDCFSEVEMFDSSAGKWIYTLPMKHKRFGPAAGEINNALYVIGGYDGSNYLSSIERYDPRENSWIRLNDMNARRGCHSVAVLNEKIYALGGHDGANMVSTVEIFDPRNGLWSAGEPLNNNRGYSGTVVVGGKIYTIGGMKDRSQVLDTVECYEEGSGWEVTNLNAVGKRCFFSALLL